MTPPAGGVGLLVDGLEVVAATTDGHRVRIDAGRGRDLTVAAALEVARHLAEALDEAGADAAALPWAVAIGSQVGHEVRRTWRDALGAMGVGRRRLVNLSAMTALASGGEVPSVAVWWGRDGVDVATKRGPSTAGHGGGPQLGTDDLLRRLGALVVPDARAEDLEAHGAWAAERARAGGDDAGAPAWSAVVDLWADAVSTAVDLVDEALDVTPGVSASVAGWSLCGEPGPVDALADRLSERRGGAVTVTVDAVADATACVAAELVHHRPRAGLDVGIEAGSAAEPRLDVVVARGAPLPARREVLLRPRTSTTRHRVLVHECWGPSLAAARPVAVLDVVAPSGTDRFRLEVEVDADGLVSARCAAVG